MNFHLVLQERVQNLVAQGREVIVLGTVSAHRRSSKGIASELHTQAT
jgi:hypothetical protein